MKVTPWNNGMHLRSGGGYGFTIKQKDMDIFRREWRVVRLKLDGILDYIEVNIDKDSFWNHSCSHLIKKEIGVWFRVNHIIPWRKAHPPQLSLEHTALNKFKLKK